LTGRRAPVSLSLSDSSSDIFTLHILCLLVSPQYKSPDATRSIFPLVQHIVPRNSCCAPKLNSHHTRLLQPSSSSGRDDKPGGHLSSLCVQMSIRAKSLHCSCGALGVPSPKVVCRIILAASLPHESCCLYFPYAGYF